MFNLEQAKAHFPFSILNSVHDLLRSELPSDADSWKSDLTGSAPITREEIDEAIKLYGDSECKNLGDYLKTYLKLDVDILYKASQKWRSLIKELIGIDFIECKKYTVSSLSYLAGSKARENKCRMGTFFPNNSQNYRLLRMGLRG